MDKTELNREIRCQRRLEVLGTNHPRCANCGEGDDRVLELHHVAGRRHDDLTVIECRNCHRKLSDCQRDHPWTAPCADPFLAAVGNFLLGLADMLRLIVEKLAGFGEELIRRASQIEEAVS